MAKLIDRRSANEYFSKRELWMVHDRFIIKVFWDENDCSIFIEDQLEKENSLDLIPKLGKELKIFDEEGVSLLPSIDTCGVLVSKKEYDRVFRLIEEYLIKLSI